MSGPADAWFAARRRLIGVVFLAAFAMLVWLSLALYHKRFTQVATVTLLTSSVGNELHAGAEVVVRGVQVGEVRQISADGAGARLELAIQPRMLHLLPANVTAEMLPVTLFGEREVDLILPARPAAARLASGSVIPQDRSADAIELDQVLGHLFSLLTAAQPQQLSFTLTAIAQGLRGQGTALGQTLVRLDAYLRRLRPELPALDTDIRRLVRVARAYRQAAPDVLRALSDFAVVTRTVYRQRWALESLLTSVTSASGDLRSFLAGNSANIIRLSSVSTATLQLLGRYAPEFPCTLSALVAFEPAMNKVLGAGTSQPGLHVHVRVVPSLGRYLPRRNTPVYGDDLGPHCYSPPFSGITLHDGASPAVSGRGSDSAKKQAAASTAPSGRRPAGHAVTSARPGRSRRAAAKPPRGAASQRRAVTRHGAPTSRSAVTSLSALAGLGQASSPQQDELVDEIAGLALGRSPGSLPGWSSLLVGPLYRGAEVTLR